MKNRKHQHPTPTSRARQLRHDATFPERLLWSRLRNHQLAGLKFRRQYPVGPFVVDFFCHETRLAVEVDGVSHEGRAREDAERTAHLNREGIRVLRVSNDDVLREMDAVLDAILLACGRDIETGEKRPHPGPLPEGEGD